MSSFDTEERTAQAPAAEETPVAADTTTATTETTSPAEGPAGGNDDTKAPLPEASTTTTTTTPSAPAKPCALQLISTGDETDNYAFQLIEENLELVLKKVPKEAKVGVVSVVGAFRTGKSFLLTLILRYLRFKTNFDEVGDEKWLEAEGALKEGNENEGVSSDSSSSAESFHWRAGRRRMTTGISVWSEPFLLAEDNTALLLLDTQGLFDNETTMGLTSCIFGLSTLMSSFQIYNVANRIQEDNLQQLALFTEYGRMAVDQSREEEGESRPPPFQRLEFLVRDWPLFEDGQSDEEMEASMAAYLEEVFAERKADDLAFTREQIQACFQDISAWLLPHPGFAVTKLKYDGSTDQIDGLFKRSVSRFLDGVFSKGVAPKKINGQELTATELGNYVKAYVGMFSDGARFPQATTMLEATATANNKNSKDRAFEVYNDVMDRACGTHKDATFLPQDELATTFSKAEKDALAVFDAKANMGRRAAVDSTRADLRADILKAKSHYKLMNDARNPFLNAHLYALPLAVAACAWLVRKVTDTVCPDEGSFVAQTCNVAEDFLHEVYMLILFAVLAYVAFKTYGLSSHLKKIALVAFEAAKASSASGGGHSKHD